MGLAADDASQDAEIEEYSPEKKLAMLCGWQFGDPGGRDIPHLGEGVWLFRYDEEITRDSEGRCPWENETPSRKEN